MNCLILFKSQTGEDFNLKGSVSNFDFYGISVTTVISSLKNLVAEVLRVSSLAYFRKGINVLNCISVGFWL